MSMDDLHAGNDALKLAARPAPAGALSTVITLAWRAMLKIKHIPFQLFDVTVTPIMFTLLFTYMFGGALAGSPEVYIQSLSARHPGSNHRLHHGLYRGRGQQRHSEGSLRPLPVASHVAAVADPGRARRRPISLLGGVDLDHRARADPGLSPSRGRNRGALCIRPRARLLLRRVLDLDHLRHAGEDARSGDDDELPLSDATDVGSNISSIRRRCPAGCRCSCTGTPSRT